MASIYITGKLTHILAVLNVQPFKGKSRAGSDPSHYSAAAPPPPTLQMDAHLPSISSPQWGSAVCTTEQE